VALVLGAAGPGNMGQAIARAFAREGARVMVAGRTEAPLRDIAAEIGGRCCAVRHHARGGHRGRDPATLEAFGQIRHRVNATGWGLLKPFLETTREDWSR